MNRELKRLSVAILAMFTALLCSSTTIAVLQVDNLRADPRNVRTLYDSYSAERGPILVAGKPIAQSSPVDDEYKYLRTYLEPYLYAPVTGYFTLNQGNTGIEGTMNAYLSGTANDQFLAQVNAILTGQTPKGAAVQLTIDPEIQQVAWDALGDHKGAVVAIDPKTGAILAMVSKPSFDPNTLAGHDTDLVISTYNKLLSDPTDPLINRAISGDLYHPGSTFKLIVASAAIDSGQFEPSSEFPNPSSLQLPQSTSVIHNSGNGTCGPGETVTIADALRLSCNIPFAELGEALGQDLLLKYTEKFGFGQDLGVPMTVTPSQIPDDLDDPQLMLSSFGQANVLVTPLQMAMVSAAIANKGVMMKPTLINSIIAPDLTILQPFSPEVFAQPISQGTSETMTTLMVANVANGAASNGRIGGVDVAGKTGTAQNGEGQLLTLWFTGFAPADNPKVAVAVVVEDSTSFGNAVAAPIAQKVMEAVLKQ
ncbi:MAG: penicillin-binding protein 2 [Microbacteriaceae bacterium]|nr:penicillin-binding protein 2 [Microbacteriaceae bacterium]